ncbi:MAG TPA: c-type cytochrome [Candidatus Acidoferrum sp.]|nr:c-type cytochrome [Candidatus Acidoferrum sp.]
MPAEEMGKLTSRMRLIFAVSSVIFLLVLAISPFKDYRREWKQYKRAYVRFAQSRPDTKRLTADYSPNIDQIWLPGMNVTDRCTTCHQGITQLSLADASVPQPFRAHPPIPHNVRDWGCTVCHRGQGPATEVAEAHESTLAWEQPVLPTHFIQASCGSCHLSDLPQTPQLSRGKQLLARLNCQGCHKLPGIETPVMRGPDLSSIGTKVSREWIYKWLKEPRTVTDKDGNVTVNGYETVDEPRMPKFRLTEAELVGLTAYLSAQKAMPLPAYKISAAVVASWSKNPELASQGELRFRQMFCSTCHSLAVTRAGETKLIGGDIGPELTKVGSKVNPDWLIAWLRDPESYLPHTRMPRYGWSDEDLYKVTQYITTKLVDSDLLSSVPKLDPPTDEQMQLGKRLFLEKGCASCHAIAGLNPQKDFGPDLSALGGKNASELEFGAAKIPHNLVSYIQAKLQDPVSVNPAARMPQYNWNQADLDAVTTALLSMKGPPATSALQNLVVPRKEAVFHATGSFAAVYERYKCYTCHKFNGYGGDLAPELTYEGSRAQRQWLIEFLKSPQTLRPTLVLRMPQFNMSDKDASTLADYISMVLQNPAVNPATTDAKQFTPAMAALGKQLYEVKYQCQACHTIGSSGGYVGPNLNNAGSWLTPAWIEAWLKNPQALVPDTVEPHRNFTDQEINGLTAYLMTLHAGSKPQKTAGNSGTAAVSEGAGQ